METVAIIPARFASTRLPGKPLADICGKPMIVRVAERASMVKGIDRVVVATDSHRILNEVNGYGFHGVITSEQHPSGTDRIYEAARKLELSGDCIIVNIQGDQPLFEPKAVEAMVNLLKDGRFPMTTVACPMSIEEAQDPNRVKVVLDRFGKAVYFSRSLIPFDRDGLLKGKARPYLRHLGLYCYRVDFLKDFVSWPTGTLENIEKLEQLRVLENGGSIGVVVVSDAPPEVDTKEDLEKIRRLFDADMA